MGVSCLSPAETDAHASRIRRYAAADADVQMRKRSAHSPKALGKAEKAAASDVSCLLSAFVASFAPELSLPLLGMLREQRQLQCMQRNACRSIPDESLLKRRCSQREEVVGAAAHIYETLQWQLLWSRIQAGCSGRCGGSSGGVGRRHRGAAAAAFPEFVFSGDRREGNGSLQHEAPYKEEASCAKLQTQTHCVVEDHQQTASFTQKKPPSPPDSCVAPSASPSHCSNCKLSACTSAAATCVMRLQ
ncbi:hypothetical protein cyc_02657 [Cyclospora cayetanensis]|uniref:Uncharacterized protein n=1 Tax=Cyclospora cayetanensis TaxID=88456 RepID=A0A1D3CVN8_9EIME|nr:hypothetical protein cyc_02657 [Cyclospora cayetanensis]